MMHPKFVRACFVMVVLAATPPMRPLSAQENAHSQVVAADRALSDSVFASGIAQRFPAALGPHGVLLWPGAELIAGDSMFSRFFARQPLLTDVRLSWQPLRVEVSRDASLALVSGVSVADRPATGPINPIHRIGRYLAAWRRTPSGWRLEAFELLNVFAAGETIWNARIGSAALPALRAEGAIRDFVIADSTASADAGATTIGAALRKWAADDGMTFGSTGELNIGPTAIGAVLVTNDAHWRWRVIVGGAANDASLGWTAGTTDVTPSNGGATVHTKYLTLWRRGPDGRIRFIARGNTSVP